MGKEVNGSIVKAESSVQIVPVDALSDSHKSPIFAVQIGNNRLIQLIFDSQVLHHTMMIAVAQESAQEIVAIITKYQPPELIIMFIAEKRMIQRVGAVAVSGIHPQAFQRERACGSAVNAKANVLGKHPRPANEIFETTGMFCLGTPQGVICTAECMG